MQERSCVKLFISLRNGILLRKTNKFINKVGENKMRIHNDNLLIRDAKVEDASLLGQWWNDGRVMAHAGFPNGLGITHEEVCQVIRKRSSDADRLLMMEAAALPIGEMNYRSLGNGTAEIGIKICDISKQDKGYGKSLLSMLIHTLFTEYGYDKIVLDTNADNKRAQHVYEKLGFQRVSTRENAWKNQLNEWQTAIDYELQKKNFISQL